MRWIGVALLPPLGGGACFVGLMLASTFAITSGAAWIHPFEARRVLDQHIDLMQIAYSVLALHGCYTIVLALRAAASREAKAAHPILLPIIAAVMTVPAVIFGLSTPLAELQFEMPVALVMLGIPLLVMIAIAERVAFGPRNPPPPPEEPKSRWAVPPRPR